VEIIDFVEFAAMAGQDYPQNERRRMLENFVKNSTRPRIVNKFLLLLCRFFGYHWGH